MRPEELRERQTRDAATDEELRELVDREFSVIGTRMRRIDGVAKATGGAVYTDDIALPGMLHAKILRSPHPHARIVSIDTSRAEALPGVRAVVTGRDMPTKYGIIPWTRDEEALCVDRVRYIGDAVAAVAAIDEDTAIRALELIDVEYEELPAFLEPEHALNPLEGAVPIHEPKKPGHNGNITKIVRLEFGPVDRAKAITSSRARPTRRSSRTAPSAGTTRPASSPSGPRRRCRTTCTGNWRASSTSTSPASVWSSRRSAAPSAASRSRSTSSSASRCSRCAPVGR